MAERVCGNTVAFGLPFNKFNTRRLLGLGQPALVKQVSGQTGPQVCGMNQEAVLSGR